jgi:hypothetical protein
MHLSFDKALSLRPKALIHSLFFPIAASERGCSPLNMTVNGDHDCALAVDMSAGHHVAAHVLIDGSVSPASNSSGVSSLGSSWASNALLMRNCNLTEAEALLQLSNQETDEGIVSDHSDRLSSSDLGEDANKRIKVSVVSVRACTKA